MNRYQLHQVTEDELEFLCRVYVGTREEEMAANGWSAAQAEQFLRFQFAVQDRQYRTGFKNASFYIIRVDGEPAGRLYIDRSGDSMRIIDIALLPEYRNRGTGTAVLKDIIAEATAAQRSLTLSVAFDNRVIKLYKRLGFKVTGSDGVYYSMLYPLCTQPVHTVPNE